MKIAIIGSGISGLGAAYLLHKQYDITLYEKNNYIGGHTRTVDANTPKGVVPVDTGFIVFNYRNYPLLSALFKELDVPVEKSDMSFGASIDDGWIEYSTTRLSHLFAQRRNIIRPAFIRMISDILRFNKKSLVYMDKDSDVSLGSCLSELGMGEWFKHYYILAVGGAIWSCPLEQMLEFPAKTFIRFFHNHGLLTVNDQPQWYTVTGGSKEYVKRITQGFKDNIRLECGAKNVKRQENTVVVEDTQGNHEQYDHVIFACHGDQAIEILEQPSQDEQDVIGKFKYQQNHIILHCDTSFMPKNKKCWASWVYLSESRKDEKPLISLSYWMNNLQNIDREIPLIVTLNPGRRPNEEMIYDEYDFEHPIFDKGAIDAQESLDGIQGQNNTWYCGAYHRYGFHEDGLLSAVNVVKKLGIEVPWK